MSRRALNAQHDWSVAGSVLATINPPPDTATFPRADIPAAKGVQGWFSLPDTDDPAADAPVGRRGEVPHATTSRGKTLTYPLRYKGNPKGSYEDMMEALQAFGAKFEDRSSTGLLTVTPWENVDAPGDGEVWATYARVLDYDADDAQIYGPGRIPSVWMRDPILSFRQLDGRWLLWNESGTSGTPMAFADSGAAVIVDNTGTAPTEPVITVASVAASADVHLGRDLAGGGSVGLWFLNLPAGTLVVDFSARTAMVGSTDVTDHLDSANSEWWDAGVDGVPPGVHNLWRGPAAGGNISASFFSASW